MQRWHVLRGPWFDCSVWKLPSRLVLPRRRPQRVLHPVPVGYIPSRCRAAIMHAMHARKFLQQYWSHCCRWPVSAWQLLPRWRQFISLHQLRCWNVLCWYRPWRSVWPLSGGFILCFRRVGRRVHPVSRRPLSRPNGPVVVHALQPGFVSKCIRTTFLSFMLAWHVLCNVGTDCSNWIVPSRLVFSRSSNCDDMHRMRPRLVPTCSGTGSVHAL